MMKSSWTTILVVFSILSGASGLRVTAGSDCAALCSDNLNSTEVEPVSPTTNSSDIVCEDVNYFSTGTGIKFRNCATCLQKSQAAKDSESDVTWFLYNLRYAVDVCLFNFPDSNLGISSPCNINYACQPLRNALTIELLSPDGGNQYDYCQADSAKFFGNNYWSCVQCLQASENQAYLSNFLIALKAGCKQKPAPGALLALTGEIFSDNPVNITDAPSNTTLPGDGGASSGTMTIGTIVGIAVGGGLLFVGAICLFVIYCRRQRKIRASDDIDRSSPPPRSDASSFTAINRSPYMPIADHKKSTSIRSFNYELQEKQNYTNNSEYYDKLEEEIRAGRNNANYNFNPHVLHHGPNSALPTHPAYIPRAMSRQSTREVSPTPPTRQRTNTPDSYALQTYLKAAEESTGVPVPPPLPVARKTPSPAPPPLSLSQSSYSQFALQQTAATAPAPPPPPPGPPPARQRSSRIPSLVLPSVPRIRVPKKYSPPKIVVEGATPVADPGDTRRLNISEPLAFHEERFKDQPLGGPVVYSKTAPVRDDNFSDYERDIPIGSGKSTLYGY